MTKEQAYERFELPVGSDLQTVRRKFAEMHNDYRMRIENAPTPRLKQTFESGLEELKEAYALLNESDGMDDSAELPRTERSFEQQERDTKAQQAPPPQQEEEQLPKEKAPPVYEVPPAKSRSNVGLIVGIAASAIVVLAGFYFLSNRAGNPGSSAATADPRQDSIAWEAALAGSNVTSYEHYLKQYPEGIFAQAATDSLTQIKATHPQETTSTPEEKETGQGFAEQQERTKELERQKKEEIAAREAARKQQEKSKLTPSQLNDKGEEFYNAKNYTEAMKWYRPAADQGNLEAQYSLGFMYNKGRGVSQNYTEAAKWYRKAADRGHVVAQFNLSFLYRNGNGVPQDNAKEFYWCQKAAEQGYLNAQYQLGRLYHYGRGVSKDYAQAIYWYQKAADQGDGEAYNNLGVMYENGEGISKDLTKAIGFYKEGVKKGNSTAINNLKRLGITDY